MMAWRISRTPARDFMVSRGWRWNLATLVDLPDEKAIAAGARWRQVRKVIRQAQRRRWLLAHQSNASPRAITAKVAPSARDIASPVSSAPSITLAPQPRKAITKRERPSAATAV